MKFVLPLFCVVFVGYVAAETKTYSRGCIYINGRCHRECEVGTHAYTTGCGIKTDEATCDEPSPKPDKFGMICDYSACYCDSPTVRDTTTKKCVKIEDCPKKDKTEKAEINDEKKGST